MALWPAQQDDPVTVEVDEDPQQDRPRWAHGIRRPVGVGAAEHVRDLSCIVTDAELGHRHKVIAIEMAASRRARRRRLLRRRRRRLATCRLSGTCERLGNGLERSVGGDGVFRPEEGVVAFGRLDLRAPLPAPSWDADVLARRSALVVLRRPNRHCSVCTRFDAKRDLQIIRSGSAAPERAPPHVDRRGVYAPLSPFRAPIYSIAYRPGCRAVGVGHD